VTLGCHTGLFRAWIVQLIKGKHLLGVELGLSQVKAPVIGCRGRYRFAGARFFAARRRGPRVVKNKNREGGSV
jgi:hypothetical protein